MATEASIVRDNAFIARYRICSSTGRYWTRKMLIDGCVRKTSMPRTEVIAVVDNDAFLRSEAGQIPARVIDSIVQRIFEMRAAKEL